MRVLGLLLIFALSSSTVSEVSFAPWQGALLRAAATDCSVCTITDAALKQELPDTIFAILASKCSALPAKLGQLCEQGIHKIVDHVQTAAKGMIPDCSFLCAMPSDLSTDHACFLLDLAHDGLGPMLEDVSKSLLPQICKTDSNPLECAQKTGKILTILKGPISGVMKKLAKGLACSQFENEAETAEKMASSMVDWSMENLRCSGCQATVKLLAVAAADESEGDLRSTITETFMTACVRAREHDAVSMEGAPECEEAVLNTLYLLTTDYRSNDVMCQYAYDCKPLNKKKEDETASEEGDGSVEDAPKEEL